MTIRNLNRLFQPRSVALVGASARAGSLGAAVLANLRNGGFRGSLHLINPRHRDIGGIACAARLKPRPWAFPPPWLSPPTRAMGRTRCACGSRNWLRARACALSVQIVLACCRPARGLTRVLQRIARRRAIWLSSRNREPSQRRFLHLQQRGGSDFPALSRSATQQMSTSTIFLTGSQSIPRHARS